MWDTVDFEQLLRQQPRSSARRRRCWRRRSPARAGYALARLPFRGADAFSLAVVGTQLIPGTMFLLPVFLGFIWLKQNTPIHAARHPPRADPRLHRVLHAGGDLPHAGVLPSPSPASSRRRRWSTAARASGRSCASCCRTPRPGSSPRSSTRSCSRGTSCCSPPRSPRATRDDPDRHPQLHRQLLAGVRAADGRRRRLDDPGDGRVLRHPALARARADRRGGEGMNEPASRDAASGFGVASRRVSRSRARRRGRARRVDLGPLLPHARAGSPAANRRHRLRPLPPLAEDLDLMAGAGLAPTGSRSPGRASSRPAAAAPNQRGVDFYRRLVDGTARARHRADARRSTTGICPRRCRTRRLGEPRDRLPVRRVRRATPSRRSAPTFPLGDAQRAVGGGLPRPCRRSPRRPGGGDWPGAARRPPPAAVARAGGARVPRERLRPAGAEVGIALDLTSGRPPRYGEPERRAAGARYRRRSPIAGSSIRCFAGATRRHASTFYAALRPIWPRITPATWS